MFSVVMAVYNESPSDLRQSIRSVLVQTCKDFEFIIVVDNPENVVLKNVVNEFLAVDTRIKVLVNDKNRGLAYSLNRGIEQATGDYIVRMDADDVAKTDRLEVLSAFIDGETDVYFSKYNLIDEEGRFLNTSHSMPKRDSILKMALKYKCIINHPTVMLKKETALKFRYNDLHKNEDYDLWVRLVAAGCKFKGIDAVLLDYRVRSGSMSSLDYYADYFALVYMWKYYKKNEGANLTREIYLKALGEKTEERKRFNASASRYFEIVYGRQTRTLGDYSRLGLLLVKNPALSRFFFRSVMAAVIRRCG